MSEFIEASPEPAPPRITRGGTGRRLLGGLLRNLPPLLIFTALGGLLAWGHHSDWTLPKFSSLVGEAGDKDDWCPEHSVPLSQCIECNPALMPRMTAPGWCDLHGVHECPLEHPEIAQTENPAVVTPADLARAKRALDFTKRPENNSECKLHLRLIQFASEEAVEKSGVKTEKVSTGPVVESVQGNGEVTYDQTSTARLSARVPGTVFRVYKKIGESVKKGEVLALVDAAEVGKAKAEFMQALLQVRLRTERMARLEKAYREGALSLATFVNETASLNEARIRLAISQEAMTNLGLPVNVDSFKDVPQEKLSEHLRFLGLAPSVLASLDPSKTTGNLLTVTAPFDGVVAARHAVRGEVVDSSKVLFVTVDVRLMWLTLDLRIEDAKLAALGQEVRFQPDGGAEATGKISWISTETDPKTRTVKVRASLDNSAGRLRANTFGTGKVILREESQAILVPSSAVHWEGCCHVVFVQDRNFFEPGAPKVFHVRTVRLGARNDQQTEIIAGVLPGEIVAATGSAVLRADLLKENLDSAK